MPKRKPPKFCIACGAKRPNGPDPCLGRIPGVLFACCGHGSRMPCYVTFREGPTLRYEVAQGWFRAQGFDVPDFTCELWREEGWIPGGQIPRCEIALGAHPDILPAVDWGRPLL